MTNHCTEPFRGRGLVKRVGTTQGPHRRAGACGCRSRADLCPCSRAVPQMERELVEEAVKLLEALARHQSELAGSMLPPGAALAIWRFGPEATCAFANC